MEEYLRHQGVIKSQEKQIEKLGSTLSKFMSLRGEDVAVPEELFEEARKVLLTTGYEEGEIT